MAFGPGSLGSKDIFAYCCYIPLEVEPYDEAYGTVAPRFAPALKAMPAERTDKFGNENQSAEFLIILSHRKWSKKRANLFCPSTFSAVRAFTKV